MKHLFSRTCQRVLSAGLCLSPLLKHSEVEEAEEVTEQNRLFVWFLALLVGPWLPTYRLHIHSAVSTRTAELSVSRYSSASQKTVCLCVTVVLLRLSCETDSDSQCGGLCLTETCYRTAYSYSTSENVA